MSNQQATQITINDTRAIDRELFGDNSVEFYKHLDKLDNALNSTTKAALNGQVDVSDPTYSAIQTSAGLIPYDNRQAYCAVVMFLSSQGISDDVVKHIMTIDKKSRPLVASTVTNAQVLANLKRAIFDIDPAAFYQCGIGTKLFQSLPRCFDEKNAVESTEIYRINKTRYNMIHSVFARICKALATPMTDEVTFRGVKLPKSTFHHDKGKGTMSVTFSESDHYRLGGTVFTTWTGWPKVANAHIGPMSSGGIEDQYFSLYAPWMKSVSWFGILGAVWYVVNVIDSAAQKKGQDPPEINLDLNLTKKYDKSVLKDRLYLIVKKVYGARVYIKGTRPVIDNDTKNPRELCKSDFVISTQILDNKSGYFFIAPVEGATILLTPAGPISFVPKPLVSKNSKAAIIRNYSENLQKIWTNPDAINAISELPDSYGKKLIAALIDQPTRSDAITRCVTESYDLSQETDDTDDLIYKSMGVGLQEADLEGGKADDEKEEKEAEPKAPEKHLDICEYLAEPVKMGEEVVEAQVFFHALSKLSNLQEIKDYVATLTTRRPVVEVDTVRFVCECLGIKMVEVLPENSLFTVICEMIQSLVSSAPGAEAYAAQGKFSIVRENAVPSELGLGEGVDREDVIGWIRALVKN